ncbi:hypothetical protein GGTG_11616 [Gaeumannomyces tritici R3-111a-1]|uniref:Uncharacterized protein n=1 Tax=Gaeumannomyces tritici (strain R3-111a-1) TaxID=644352 RepID=J3PDP3_GAET3|nr:hypothetical protein GGTG_11616 [Gaeumannomyces tritici R3-111a-1]EJT70593.1 hypothetical protein GGTG_11616 [Gaeumannomyces tritici R3-111a-1]
MAANEGPGAVRPKPAATPCGPQPKGHHTHRDGHLTQDHPPPTTPSWSPESSVDPSQERWNGGQHQDRDLAVMPCLKIDGWS